MDVCKKLELNPLRFDRDIKVLSQKKNIFQHFSFVRPANEKRRKSAGFQDFFNFVQLGVRLKSILVFFPTWSVIAPYSLCGSALITLG